MSPLDAAGEQWQMTEGSLLMSRKERKRLAVLAQVKSGELTPGHGWGGDGRDLSPGQAGVAAVSG
jgi:hypothetical protein